jgi:hypothetical protein
LINRCVISEASYYAKLGDLAGNINSECIAIGTRPSAIGVRIGITGDRGTDTVDYRIDTRSTLLQHDLRSGAEPVIVGAHPVNANRWGTIGDTKAEDLVPRKAWGTRWLDRDPSVYGELPRQETARTA